MNVVAKNNRKSQIINHKSERHRCVEHSDRFAAVSVQGRDLCWECHLGVKAFAERFGQEFYQPDGSGYAGED